MKNLTLIINTSEIESSILFVSEREIVSQRSWVSNKDLGEKLLTNIDEMLKEKDLTFTDIKRIAVHRGPGHYSAVRTGIVTAMALAYAWQAELVGTEGKGADQIEAAQKAKPAISIEPIYTSSVIASEAKQSQDKP